MKYNGMTAEKAIYAWIKSEFLMPKKLVFHSTNVYYELMKSSIEQKQKDHFRESKT
ncbi:PrgI family protein [Ruminococcus sp.]|uniref:PrgI family protein n=1 Tax=Ruminococcus sp. TaxID=41978 RepID=UPI003A9255CF